MGIYVLKIREIMCHDCGRCIVDDTVSDVWYRIGEFGHWYCEKCYNMNFGDDVV